MPMSTSKKAREEKTIEAMISIYCHGNHGSRTPPCHDCENLRIYAKQRVATCPLGEKKTTCAKCPIHCYKPKMREKIREVMRYAGPRMLYKHPLLALFHLFDGLNSKKKMINRSLDIMSSENA
jgi:hypothetical protein